MQISELLSYDNYLFDCDGVILNSNRIKTDVFYDVAIKFSSEENALKLKSYHIDNGGISRFQKFEYFFKTILGKHCFETELQESLTLFKELSLERCKNCDYVPGVVEFLEKIPNESKVHIVSGGLEEDLLAIFKHRELDAKFTGIYGSPKTKFEIVDIIKPEGKTLFLGDSRLDFEVAKNYNFDFLYVSGVSEWKTAKSDLVGENHLSVVDFNY